MNVFIIGATGLIGSHAARCLVASGYTVYGLARSNEAMEKLNRLNVVPVFGDVNNKKALAYGIDNSEFIIFAPSLWEKESEIVDYILDYIKKTDKTFIFCSGTAVLSELTYGDWSENSYSEYDDFTPSKFLIDRYITENKVRINNGIVVRPPVVWSNELPPLHYTGVVDSVFLTGHACYIGKGLNMYSHVHAEDLAEVFKLAIEKGSPGAVYHAVAGEVPNKWIAESIAKVAGAETKSLTMDEAIGLWGKFRALVVFGSSSRTRCPRTHLELGWNAKYTDMLSISEEYITKLVTQ